MEVHIRNFRDFLQVYNTLSETCFKSCVDSLNSRALEDEEVQCVESCADKFIRLNHRFMGVYMQAQQIVTKRRVQEVEEREREAFKAQNEALQVQNDALNAQNETLLSDTDNTGVEQFTDVSVT